MMSIKNVLQIERKNSNMCFQAVGSRNERGLQYWESKEKKSIHQETKSRYIIQTDSLL